MFLQWLFKNDLPNSFNVPLLFVIFKVVVPYTFNDDMHVVVLFNVVVPDTFNVDINVAGLLKLTIEGGFNIAL